MDNPNLEFEYAIRKVLGDEASQTVDSASSYSSSKTWYKKVFEKLQKDAQELDAPTHFKEIIDRDINHVLEVLKKRNDSFRELSHGILDISVSMFGYDHMDGKQTTQPDFWQSLDQQYKNERNRRVHLPRDSRVREIEETL